MSDWGMFAAGLLCGVMLGVFIERMLVDPLAAGWTRINNHRRGR